MKIKQIKKMIKIIGYSLLTLIVVFSVLVINFTKPKTDKKIIKEFKKEIYQPSIRYLDYKDKVVRTIHMQNLLDTALNTLVFVHGSPGSSMDFKAYLKDMDLNEKANIIAFDRIGYDIENKGKVLNSLNEEIEVLDLVLKGLDPQKIIIIGYSYGGTLVMSSPRNYKKKIVLAAAVRGDLEPMFWAMKLYEWKFTRPIVPKVFQAASKEKLRHVTELEGYGKQWPISASPVLSIHGKKDKIVPFDNSVFLEELFDENKFTLLPIEKGNHALVWTNFELIKKEILKSLDE